MDNLTYFLADILALIRSKKADLASAQASCRALTGLEGITTNPPAEAGGLVLFPIKESYLVVTVMVCTNTRSM